MAEIIIHGITVETAEIRTTDDALRDARETGMLDHEYDTPLSDMDGETMIVLPDGTVIDPYSGAEGVNLLEILEPILAHVPTWRIDQYAARRRSEEE